MSAGDVVRTTETAHRKFEVFEDKAGEFRWRILHKDEADDQGDLKIGGGSEDSFASADEAIADLEESVPAAKPRA